MYHLQDYRYKLDIGSANKASTLHGGQVSNPVMANYFCELVIANTGNNGVSVKNSLNFMSLSSAIHIYLHEAEPSLIIHKLILPR